MQPAQLEVTARRNWSQDFNPNCPPLYHFTPGGKDWGQKEKGSDRGWNGWTASLTQRTWVWANSGKSWRTGMPGMLQSIGAADSDMTEQLNNSMYYENAWSLNRSAWKNEAASTWASEPEWLLRVLLCGLSKHLACGSNTSFLCQVRVSHGF